MNDVYTLTRPDTPALPLIFDSPHSGTLYPEDFGYACDFHTLESAEDKYVDDLFQNAPAHGAALLCAHFPRSYIDVNRADDDIDPQLLSHPWNGPAPINPTARSDAGIGLIRRLVRPGIPVYDRPLSSAEITARIERYYAPYHEALEALITEAHYNFGQVWHMNCHSMPESTAHPRRPSLLRGGTPPASDFVLGTLDGMSSAADFTHMIRDCLKGMGYTVTINDPFRGAELIARHACPSRGIHSLQIEINKVLYMDESSQEKTNHYSELKHDIEKLIEECAAFVQERLTTALAAD